MFDSFREKLQSVQGNLSASLRSFSASDERSRLSSNIAHLEKVNFNAGVDVLDSFQSTWAELHGNTRINAQRAQAVDEAIGKLHRKLEIQWRNISQLTSALSRLPEVIHEVDILSEKLVSVDELFLNVEKSLIHLEDLIETRELQERQLDHRFQLALYKEKKLCLLENTRMTLAREHAEKVALHEAQQQQVKQERQKAFEEQFKQDLSIYKETNAIPKLEIRSTISPETLDEVVLDSADDAAFKEFLETTQEEAFEVSSVTEPADGENNDQ